MGNIQETGGQTRHQARAENTPETTSLRPTRPAQGHRRALRPWGLESGVVAADDPTGWGPGLGHHPWCPADTQGTAHRRDRASSTARITR